MKTPRILIAMLMLSACMAFAERPEPPPLTHKQSTLDMQDYHGAGLRRRMWRFLVIGKTTRPNPVEMKAYALWWYQNAAPQYYDEITIYYHLDGIPWQNGAYAGYTFRKGKGLVEKFVSAENLWLRDNWDKLD